MSETIPFYIPYDRIKLGDSATMSVTFTPEQMQSFAVLFGDTNSFHLTPEATAVTAYQRQVIQGGLSSGYFPLVVAQQLPGFGAILCDIYTRFVSPIFLGDTITYQITVTEKGAHQRILLETKAINEDGQLCIEGYLVVKTFD